MNQRVGAAGLGLAMAVWAGCGGGDGPAVTVADSAGVRVVTSGTGSLEGAAAWTLSPEPVLEIGGGADPEVPLYRVSAVTPLPGGGVAVGTESPPRALVFGPDGALTAALGRAGGGPGEFQRVASVAAMPGDSLAVWDPDRRRISVFTGDGRFAREVDLSDVAPIGLMAAPSTNAPAAWTYLLSHPAGGFVLFSVGAFGPGEGARRPEAPSYRIPASGRGVTELGRFPGYQSYSSEQTGVTLYPFGMDTYGVLSGSALVVGTAESPELRYYGPDGGLERIVRWPDPDRRLEGGRYVAEWDSMLTSWLEPMPEGRRAMMRDMFDRIPRPERFPAYDGVIAGSDGRVWVGEYVGILAIAATPIDRRVPARRWLVFDRAGALAATVETPAGFQPHAASGDRVWGVYRDAVDVESVRAYATIRP